jgi:hypothetical protein
LASLATSTMVARSAARVAVNNAFLTGGNRSQSCKRFQS